ncbi:AtpC F0F1-type ATP synthase, epsilon subunit (mitochondrial delta subunit) [Candidatus Methylopumilus universalis]|jgi:F-type H+-transporting ATPase subunit epsilon|uniref:ATP synthase epsilon chain n=1 Tax=Candidatus Methylopumilus planktonicus TaxID=1581557 RepID=A0A0D6EXQ9_9PROT|nr:F0F1 ATP synthase subunit epsilon [Candidatus Methylopumilus planktonicus]MCX7191750.1 F0F1 ATP synthase subunit epsilon [Candidatus Methylopumilus sp.]MDH4407553.1 F0F1 ATP synthase subunit epsilon [Candidatus Methylopumilus sp.]QDD00912.1 F0F1 ATP synthase subunit epsilon [Candidatus Methylopumilus planktonicus]QDD02245.1 F0F1 ATP synthase subunit epsilon [Candidatus Methylopumilus planktonicus]QDD07507.1 F0F1 ATP synthase subunit epsilon [Candidatus Methylopumilus planktonicus]
MVATVHIDVVSAEESIFSGEAEFIAAPAQMGEVGIYPHHAPMITSIKPGALRIKLADKNEEQLIYISGGILEVQPGVVTVLADTAIRGHDLDEAQANAAKKAAEEAMKNRSSDVDYAKAQAELAEAIAQIQAIQKLRQKH